MKKICLLFGALVLFGSGVFAQTLTVQPYVFFDWDPAYYDPGTGEESYNHRAFNFDRAGVKITGTLDKVSAYIEVRGFPSGSNSYNEYDGFSASQISSSTKPVYYAWGKYQLTETGNIWAGKFKPNFGPILFDTSHFGIGWQQKLSGGHTVSGYVFQPSAAINAFNPITWGQSLAGSDGIPADEGIRFLVLDEYMSKTLVVFGGASYDYLGNDYNKLHFNVFASYLGIPDLTLSAEGAMAVYIKEDGVVKDRRDPTETENIGIGLGAYLSAEYPVVKPLSLGAYIKLVDPLLGAEQNMPRSGKDINAVLDGEINTATFGLYLKYTPAKGFYIQPQMNVKFANALNGYTPRNADGEDGKKAGVDFQLTFRWEPSMSLRTASRAVS